VGVVYRCVRVTLVEGYTLTHMHRTPCSMRRGGWCGCQGGAGLGVVDVNNHVLWQQGRSSLAGAGLACDTTPVLECLCHLTCPACADKCSWTFGSTYTTSSGAAANMKLGAYDYLIQQVCTYLIASFLV
jgi:hypothetical protein